jgi:hypothetical protein
MASHGTRVFVLGGEALAEGQADDTALIHVLNTSTVCRLFSSCDLIRAASKIEHRVHQVPEI